MMIFILRWRVAGVVLGRDAMISHPHIHTKVTGEGHLSIGHSGVGGSYPTTIHLRSRTDAMSSHPYLKPPRRSVTGEPAFRFNGGTATHAGGSDGLAIDVVRAITRDEDARNLGADRVRPGNEIAAFIDL